ncbi:MAG: alpha-hydroxy-acid oxidizing protein [Desulfovibrio sp.]|nr:alpha-hydroxy-acid oxidizing protein [Desulfovibrio sp.]
MREIRIRAGEKLKGVCRVCANCDGRVCAGEVPGMGGIGSGAAFMENVRAFRAVKLNLRALHSSPVPDTGTELWGHSLSLPVMTAPLAGAAVNMGGALSEEELADGLHAGSRAAETVAWSGDAFVPGIFEAGLAAVRKQGGCGIVTVKPHGVEEIIRRVRMAEDAGAIAAAVDVDAAAFRPPAPGLPVGAGNPADLEKIVRSAKLPIILKGIMTPDEAVVAAAVGISGIVVSNHGGRALEACPATAEALPAVAAAVRGRMKIFVDGGLRNGADVLKALAMGADAVLIGRPLVPPVVGGGAEGVALYFKKLASELTAAMILTGTGAVRAVGPHVLRPPADFQAFRTP